MPCEGSDSLILRLSGVSPVEIRYADPLEEAKVWMDFRSRKEQQNW
jgi:hypothetical protein